MISVPFGNSCVKNLRNQYNIIGLKSISFEFLGYVVLLHLILRPFYSWRGDNVHVVPMDGIWEPRNDMG